MAAFKIFTSNRLEVLMDSLAGFIASPLPSPFTPEIIVVQSKGMERWVSMGLAGRFGICANAKFPFPNAFMWDAFREAVPDLAEEDVFSPEAMLWKILAVLPDCLALDEFQELRAYTDGESKDLRLFQLAEKLAELYDRYLVFRPKLIRRWDQGKGKVWQAHLWREISKEKAQWNKVSLRERFFKSLAAGRPRIPERISVFGISALPPFHIEIFQALSQYAEVGFFLLNPCGEYWFDIQSERALVRRRVIKAQDLLHYERGNRLLSSMGTAGKDFFEILYAHEFEDFPLFQAPEAQTLLGTIQNDLFRLFDRDIHTEKKIIAEEDRSVQIHSCHSAMREVEILHDWLLEMFELMSGLAPSDIVVMTPDIETYAPLIDAVFGAPENENMRIPYAISDRSSPGSRGLAHAFDAILGLCGGRFGADEVLGILEYPEVQRRFNLSFEDLESLQRWMNEVRIYWGYDESEKKRAGLPAIAQNTWKEGIKRLFLGYALGGAEEELFKGMLPYPQVEGNSARLLGCFTEFIEVLFQSVTLLEKSRPLSEWSQVLSDVLERVFSASQDADEELETIRRWIASFSARQKESGFGAAVDVSVIRSHFSHQLKKQRSVRGFISGGVTFCAMLPMRSIPFRVLCLIGMNEGAFPRRDVKLGFDLVARKARKGDRSLRNEDRYIFLEALISARDCLYASYIGQNQYDAGVSLPSSVVSEFMEYIDRGFQDASGRSALARIFRQHPMQAFSRKYFLRQTGLFSYSRKQFEALKTSCLTRQKVRPFFDLKLPPIALQEVSVKDLLNFYSNPARHICRHRLRVYFESESGRMADKEAFILAGLDKYLVAQKIIEKTLQGAGADEIFHWLTAAGLLPHGAVGECAFRMLAEEIADHAAKIRALTDGQTLSEFPVELSVKSYHIAGQIGPVAPCGMVGARYGNINGRDHICQWISHLLLQAQGMKGWDGKSFLIGKEEFFRYGPADDPLHVLENLLDGYAKGMCAPLPFFPKTAWKFAEKIFISGDAGAGFGTAQKVWNGGPPPAPAGEKEDPYYQKCFADDPLNDEFQETALEIFQPLLRAIQQD